MNFVNEIPRPSASWFKSINKIIAKQYEDDILNELYMSPKYICLLKTKLLPFVKWASFQRLDYLPNLSEEITDFFKIKAWQNIRFIDISIKDWMKLRKTVFERDNYTCVYCNSKALVIECDHVIPITKGGSSNIRNLVTACKDCNRTKKNKSVNEFLSYKKNNAK